MKKLLVILGAVALLISGNALAQNPDPDEICIYWDYPDGCSNNCISPAFGANFNGYVVIQNISEASGLSGFEFCICNAGDEPFVPPAGQYFVTGTALPPGAVNVETPPCFVVGLATPLLAEPCIMLVEIQMLSFAPPGGELPWCFGVKPTSQPSIPGQMAYAAGNDPGNLLPMYPCVGPDADSCNIFCVNNPDCPPPVAVEDATWGSIKEMYR
jgi:hypothetical protein